MYLPRTFPFGDASGTDEPSSTNDEACDAPTASPESIVLERVRMFADKILRDDDNSDEGSDGDDIEVVSNCDSIQVVSLSPISNTMVVSYAELMTKLRKLVLSSMYDLPENFVHASSCLEGKDRGSLKGDARSAREAKSLVGRWLEKPSGAASPSSPSHVDNCIERDMIISANLIVGRGASSVTVAKHYRVVDIHGKYYNKWFMSKVTSKKWKKDYKFKLKARIQEINAVQEYEDVDLHDTFYKKGAVSRIVTDEEVMNVIGQLKRV